MVVQYSHGLSEVTVFVDSQNGLISKIQYILCVRHMTGNDQDYLREIPRVVVQKSALL